MVAIQNVDAQSWTALFRAFCSHQQPSAYLTNSIPQMDKPLGLSGQIFRACTVAEAFYGINNFLLVVLFKTREKLLGSCSKDRHKLSLLQGLPSA